MYPIVPRGCSPCRQSTGIGQRGRSLWYSATSRCTHWQLIGGTRARESLRPSSHQPQSPVQISLDR